MKQDGELSDGGHNKQWLHDRLKSLKYKLHILYPKGFADNPTEYIFADWDRFFRDKRILTGCAQATVRQVKEWAKEWETAINKTPDKIRIIGLVVLMESICLK